MRRWSLLVILGSLSLVAIALIQRVRYVRLEANLRYTDLSFGSRTTGRLFGKDRFSYVGSARLFYGPNIPILVLGDGGIDLPSVGSPSPPPFVIAFIASTPPSLGSVVFDSKPHFWTAEHPDNFSVTTRIRFDSAEYTILHYLDQSPDNECRLALKIDGETFDLRSGKLFVVAKTKDGTVVQQFVMKTIGMEILPKDGSGTFESSKPLIDWWRDTEQAIDIPRG